MKVDEGRSLFIALLSREQRILWKGSPRNLVAERQHSTFDSLSLRVSHAVSVSQKPKSVIKKDSMLLSRINSTQHTTLVPPKKIAKKLRKKRIFSPRGNRTMIARIMRGRNRSNASSEKTSIRRGAHVDRRLNGSSANRRFRSRLGRPDATTLASRAHHFY